MDSNVSTVNNYQNSIDTIQIDKIMIDYFFANKHHLSEYDSITQMAHLKNYLIIFDIIPHIIAKVKR